MLAKGTPAVGTVSAVYLDTQTQASWHFIASWWRHQMETFSALLAICAGNSPVPGVFPAQRPVTRSVDVFFDLRLNKRLSKQPWGWWFETPSRLLWRHCNVIFFHKIYVTTDLKKGLANEISDELVRNALFWMTTGSCNAVKECPVIRYIRRYSSTETFYDEGFSSGSETWRLLLPILHTPRVNIS